MKIKEEYRDMCKQLVASVFIAEADCADQLDAIMHDSSLTDEEKSEKYLGCVVDHMEFAEK